MAEQNTQTLVVHGQYVKDLSFENPMAPESFQNQEEPTFEVSIDVKAGDVGTDVYEVVLQVEVKSAVKAKTMFVASLQYAGVFTIQAANEEDLERILLVQCPSILFPFGRRIVSDLVRDGGYPPLLLHPVDFLGLYLSKKSQNPEPPANLNN